MQHLLDIPTTREYPDLALFVVASDDARQTPKSQSGSTDSGYQLEIANTTRTNAPLRHPYLRLLYPLALLQNGGYPIARRGGQGTPVGGASVCPFDFPQRP